VRRKANPPHEFNFRQRGYSSAWDRLSRRARRLQPFCTDCGTRGSLDNPLTADHLRWPARSLRDVEVVCRRCNSARGPVRDFGQRPKISTAVDNRQGGEPSAAGAGAQRGDASSPLQIPKAAG
jgi:5-methylcytosine-specific restriction protein A